MRKPTKTSPGVSETVIEMAAELVDPAMWAAMQLSKPVDPPPKTIGEVHDKIKQIMSQAIDMAMKAKWDRLLNRLNTLAVGYIDMSATAEDPAWKRDRRTQAETMREAMDVVRRIAREDVP